LEANYVLKSYEFYRNSLHFMKPGGIHLCTQQFTTGYYLEPDESSVGPPILFLENPL